MSNLDRLRVTYGLTVRIQVNEHTAPPRIHIAFGSVPSADVENALAPYKALSKYPLIDADLSSKVCCRISLDNTVIPPIEVAKALAKDLAELGLDVSLKKAVYQPRLSYVEVPS